MRPDREREKAPLSLRLKLVLALFYLLLAIAFGLIGIWRWNHEAVRLYDAPRIPWGPQ